MIQTIKKNLLATAILIGSTILTGFFLFNYNRLNILLSEKENEITQYTSRISDLESQIAVLQTNFLVLKTENEELQSQVETLRSEIERTRMIIANHLGYGNLTVKDSKLLIELNPSLVILDVRSASEYDSGHIDGAININVEELESRLDELDLNNEYLVYCRLGIRSTRAMSILNDNGFYKVYNMLGGITAWKAVGYPVV